MIALTPRLDSLDEFLTLGPLKSLNQLVHSGVLLLSLAPLMQHVVCHLLDLRTIDGNLREESAL